MAKYKNQWNVKIDRPIKFKGKFATLGRTATAEACSVLNGNALKLWMYFMFQQPSIKWDISPQAIENEGWIPKKSYYPARDELIKKGYMDKHAVYMFPKISTTENTDSDIPNTGTSTTENKYRNNTKENNINTSKNFVITSDDKVEEEPKEELQIVNASELDFIYHYSFNDEWRDKVENDILVLPNGKKVKVR